MGINVDSILCILCPEPPRFLQLASLDKFARRVLPWLATAFVHSAVVTVPLLLWRIVGRRPLTLPGTKLALHPAEAPVMACLMLIIVTALVYSVSKQLTASQQWQAAKREYQLTPESVIGDDLSWQRAWSPQGPSIPQGDASALVVDRSMQQPRVSYQHKSSDKNEKLFAKILSMKERLYGSNSEISISGPRDLATAAVEINRLCDAVGMDRLDGGIDTSVLMHKLQGLEAEIGQQ